jgi:Coenzyme PQQ synthesis protein D (PqqD)
VNRRASAPGAPTIRHVGERARVPEHVVYRAFKRETLMLNLRTGQYHGLNETGGRTLELLEHGGGQVSAAGELLAAEYGLPVDEAHRQMRSFCVALAERGLIELDG